MTGTDLINVERARQMISEHWTPEHDDKHIDEQLARAAVCYALPFSLRVGVFSRFIFTLWPWSWEWFKPTPCDRIRELTKAGALIAAEIDRLQRLQKTNP